MTRRDALLSPVLALLPAVLVPTTDDLPPREFHRFSRAFDRWDRIDPHDMKPGDVVWVRDPGGELDTVLLVDRTDNDKREFYASHHIDKATNKWVAGSGVD